ncbi:MAG: hypothetical protein ACTS44_01350 [Candidatus Hodgkinia cicadicola]
MWNGRVWRRSGSLGAEVRRKWFAFMLKPGRRGVLSSKHVKLGWVRGLGPWIVGEPTIVLDSAGS